MTNPFEFIDPTVDWITCTMFSAQARGMAKALWYHVAEEEREYDKEPRQWVFKGYRGFTTKYVSWGTREDSDIFVLRGQIANAWFGQVLDSADNVTRLDLAVTIRFREPSDQLIQRYWDHICDRWPKGAAPRSYARVIGLDGGATLYVGKRVSAEFGRVYDKGIQASLAPEATMWRYEVEIKKPSASLVAASLPRDLSPGPWIQAYVFDWFFAREVMPAFDRTEVSIVVERYARVKSDEITIAWLRKSVKPAILRLQSSGKLEQVLEALGLAEEMD